MDFDKYTPKTPYPTMDSSLPTKAEIETGLRRGWLTQPPLSREEDYRLRAQLYQAERFDLQDQFAADALEEVGLTGHPKAAKVYALAYEYGHSSGYADVYNYLVELSDLVRD